MALTDYKVKDADFTAKDIASLSDRPSADGMGATALKERFDMGAKKVLAPKLNALIDLLNGSEGAANIGVTPIDGVAGYFLQEVLIALKLLLDDKKSIEQADREIGAKFDTSEAQALVKEITFSESTGVFTITKYDGSKQTIDTAIEKVALDVRLDGQQFVLTLVDGTEQRVDLSAFLTQTEVTSSDTITLAIENGAIVARIASGSVKLAHLNAEVTAYIDAKELAAYQSAQAAAVSEQNALNSANAAEASRQAALACQEQACLCATQAELSRQAAATSEQAAATSEQAAKKAQEEAEKAAGEAKAIAGGDFLETSVYDPNGKETDVFKYVDDAMTEKFGEEGKLPVQNGGLYINEETTEEDKVEAQEGIRKLGAFSTVQTTNPLPTIAHDTPSFWRNHLGAGNYFFNDGESFGMPQQYFFVVSFSGKDTTETIQIGFGANGAIFYTRYGSGDTWYSDWVERADSSKFLPLADGAGFHNSVYRGKSLGSAVTDAQWEAISNGTFTDLYIGDYWTIGGINYRIAAFDYYLRSGDNADLTTHHVTLVPDTSMYSAQMNSTDTTTGAYVGSEMYTEGLAQAKTTINNAFGSSHILTHRRYLQNAATNGYSTGDAWYDSTVELMTEQNVYGCRIFGNCINGTGWPNLYTTDKSQYPLFAMRPDMISNRQTYWLRDVASASYFCNVYNYGLAHAHLASSSFGVRPAFSIKS